MYSQGLLITAIGYEAAKREAIARGTVICRRSLSAIETATSDLLDKVDERWPHDNPRCDGTIMCLREKGQGHKRDCPGKTISIIAYSRGLR